MVNISYRAVIQTYTKTLLLQLSVSARYTSINSFVFKLALSFTSTEEDIKQKDAKGKEEDKEWIHRREINYVLF